MTMRALDPSVVKIKPSPARGERCAMGWVRVADLRVDESYQRPIDGRGVALIARIVRNFDWARFDTVVVSPVGEGLFAIVDGQHRATAAAAMGIDKIPARIVLLSQKEQAAAFAAINNDILRVTDFHIYRAALAAGEEWAVASDRMCRDAGVRLMNYNRPTNERQPGEIYAIGAIREWAMFRPAEGRNVLAALKASRDGGLRHESWSGRILPVYMDCAHETGLSSARLVRVLDAVGPLSAIYHNAAGVVHERKRLGNPSCSAKVQFANDLAEALARAGGAA